MQSAAAAKAAVQAAEAQVEQALSEPGFHDVKIALSMGSQASRVQIGNLVNPNGFERRSRN